MSQSEIMKNIERVDINARITALMGLMVYIGQTVEELKQKLKELESQNEN